MEPLYKQYAAIEYDASGEPTSVRLSCPDSFNFAYDVVDVIAQNEPDKTALVWCSDDKREAVFSFADLARLSIQTANLLKKAGVGKGSRVLLLLKRHYAYWYTVLALHRLGAVAIPATHMLTAEDIAYRVERADVTAAVCVAEPDLCHRVQTTFAGRPDSALFCVDGQADGFVPLEEVVGAESDKMERVATDIHEPMLLYFTSGTTGDPKAVLHSFAYPLYHIPTALLWQGVTPDGLHLSVADTGWAKAAWGKIYGQWLCHSAVFVYSCGNLFVGDLLAMMKKYGVTTFCAPPTVYRSMVKNGFDVSCFSSVRRCVTAGESMKPAIAEAFTKQTGLPIYAGYGQTETALVAANLDRPDCLTLGKPMPLYTAFLADEAGEPVRDGLGEIVLRPRDSLLSGICMGYLDADGSCVSALDEKGLFHTGDLATCAPDGRLLFEGRTDDMIKSSGYRISPQEIENVLICHPDVIDCAVTGVPDSRRGMLIQAVIVLARGLKPDETRRASILRFAHDHLANYKCPRKVVFCEHLPKTVSGKIRRVALRANPT